MLFLALLHCLLIPLTAGIIFVFGVIYSACCECSANYAYDSAPGCDYSPNYEWKWHSVLFFNRTSAMTCPEPLAREMRRSPASQVTAVEG